MGERPAVGRLAASPDPVHPILLRVGPPIGRRGSRPSKVEVVARRASTTVRRWAHLQCGMVTAELAVAIPAVMLVLACSLAGLAAGIDQIRCVDAARLAGRAAARGESIDTVRALALEAAPAGATVDVERWGGDAVVVVRASTGGWGGFVPVWTLSATATTPVEGAGWS